MKKIVNEHVSPIEVTAGMSAAYDSDAAEMSQRKPGAKPGNLNAAKSLEYAHDIEDRVDGRSLLAEGFRSHRGRLLTMFNVENLDDLDGIEREAVRRLVKRRVIREQGPGGENRAQDIDAFNAAVLRFQDAV